MQPLAPTLALGAEDGFGQAGARAACGPHLPQSIAGAKVENLIPLGSHLDIRHLQNPLHCAEWDQWCAFLPGASVFHTCAWARVLHDTYQFPPFYFRLQDEQRPLALVPVMEAGGGLTRRRGIALPFTDECPPLLADSTRFSSILDAIIAHGRNRGWRSLECRGGKALVPQAPVSLAFYGHKLDLGGGERELLRRLAGSARRCLRQAQTAGVDVQICDSIEGMETYYGLHCQTRRKHGLPPQPLDFFRNLHRHLVVPGLARTWLATYQQRAIAGAVFLHFGKQAVFKFGASDAAFLQLRANHLLMWEAIRWYARQGFEQLSLGRTSLAQEGLRRFKRGWGAAEAPIEYFKYDLRHARFVTEIDRAHGWHNELFRRLPPWLLARLGRWLYPHIA